MFRKSLLFSATLFAITACSVKATDTASDVAALKATEQAWFDLYNKGDSVGVANQYAEDGMILAPGQPAAVGNAAIRAFLATDVGSTKSANYIDKAGDINGAGVSGDMGWVSGAYILTDSSGKVVDQGKYTTVYRRANGGWKIIRDTWNSDMAPPAAPAATPPKP